MGPGTTASTAVLLLLLWVCSVLVRGAISRLPHNLVFSTSMVYIRNHSVTWVLGAPAAMQILIVN